MSVDPEYLLHKLGKALKRRTLQGAINDLIDGLFHPFFGRTCGLAEIADFLAHSLNEGKLDIDKFVRYNLDSFLGSIIRGLSPRGHRHKYYRGKKCRRRK